MAFIGQIAELVLGTDGLTGGRNLAVVRPTHLLTANNISYDSGTLRKEGGATKYNSTAISGTPAVIGGWDWFPSAGTQRMIVVLDDGTIKKDTGGGDFTVTLKSGLTLANKQPVFVEGGKEAAANNRKLFIFIDGVAVQVLSADAATTSDLTTPPADWSGANEPTFGALHEDRLWGGGNPNDPHRMYYSRTTDHEDFTGSGSGTISVFPGEGERLVGAISFKGLLVVWKFPVGIYMIDTSDSTIANWRVTRLSSAIGGVSPMGAVAIDDDIIFIDKSGTIQLISSITAFGNLGTRNLSSIADLGPFIADEVNLAELDNVRGVFYVAKREVHFGLAGSGATVNNRRLVVDFNRPDLPRFRFSERDTPESVWLKQDINNVPRLTIGDDAGFVWNLDQDTRSRDGVGYEGKFESTQVDLSFLDPVLGTRRKEGKFLEIAVEPTGNWDLNIDILWDGAITETVTFNMGITGATLGTFVLGTDKLAGSISLNRKKRITGGGRRFSIAGRNSGVGEDFSISKFYLHFLVGDERIT